VTNGIDLQAVVDKCEAVARYKELAQPGADLTPCLDLDALKQKELVMKSSATCAKRLSLMNLATDFCAD